MSDVVLTLDNLTIGLPKGADRAAAVSGLNLTLRAGEVTCLIGESGSGKSLAARAILGLLPPRVTVTGGAIAFDGQDLTRLTQKQLARIRGDRIGMIFQEPMTALNPLHSIGRQIGEVLAIHTAMGATARRARVEKLLADVHLPEPSRIARSYPHQLSGGQRQRAMIAMALALDPKLLIADEPTTALDVTTQAQILRLIHELQREHGTAVLFITHDFGVVADIADQVAVLRQGEMVESGPRDAVLNAPQHPYTKALLAAVPRLAVPVRPVEAQGLVVLESIGARKSYAAKGWFARGRATRALDGVDVQLHRGETLGLVGESGSGKSTLARAMTRLLAIDSGEIILNGESITQLTTKALRPYRQKIQMIFQDPYASLDPRQRIVDVIAEGPIIHGAVPAEARLRARDLLRLVGLDPSAAERFPHEFSGGQRQRIGIARALALQPEVLVADEPVSALDVSVQAQVLDLLADIKAKLGLSMLFVTHDLRVALQICDRIAVMQHGAIVELGTATAIFTAPRHPYTKALFAAVPGASWNQSIPAAAE
ncbi:ABC transporter ATP-binding protein [Plastoroseomonas arctica]|uniref:ABC transporter ATP-binding protein n=1 Tax=Plastoroseomonas arctica TaxID=1509237 RepID=A0AAF1JX50_9PROT|nr:ABC transporter ATP-binding protein [Plastoroseomonas arctica]MBR0655867.1 ABC transporter ATP-binding protein [Plastoroseomonas arctica]